MKIQHTFFPLIVAVVMAVFTACADEQTFLPGPDVAAGCQNVHFDAANETLTMLSPDDAQRSVKLTLVRNADGGELTVPVELVSASEGMTVSPSANFAAGATTTTIEVAAPQSVSEGTSYNYELRLGGEQVNPYIAGATIFSGSISFPKTYDFRMWYSDASGNSMASTYGYFRQTGFDLGDGRLLFTDFLHSGTDLWLMYPAGADYTAEATITTSPSYVEDDTDYPGCVQVYAYDQPTDTYTTFRPYGEGSVLTATDLCFYYGDGYTGYNPATGSGYIAVMEVNFNIDSTEKYWGAFQFRALTPDIVDNYDFSEPDFGIAPPLAADGTVLTMKARLVQNNLEFNAFQDITATVCDEGTALQFDHFMNTDYSFKLTHNLNGTFTITSDIGYQATWEYRFRNPDTDEWYLFYPSGRNDYDLGMVMNLNNALNAWDVAGHRIRITLAETFSSPDFHDTTDDYLELTW